MSTMYNMLFKSDMEKEKLLFSMLKLTPGDVGRYRDIYVTKDYIGVYTRNGGGNREDYQEVFDELSMHPLYAYDEDDSFDCTYATVFFKHPPEYSDLLKEIATNTITPSEKWNQLFKSLQG